MTDRPIIFSATMVRALLDGSKTQTRRLVKPQPGDIDRVFQMDDGSWHVTAHDGSHMSALRIPYAPGDRLWVREAWAKVSVAPIVATIDAPWTVYRACDNRTDYGGPWKPSIHMARNQSRLTLIVEGVKVERLQDISREDAIAEGLTLASAQIEQFWRWPEPLHENLWLSPKIAYADLWRTIHGPGAWDANPWVAAISFRVVKSNIDAIAEAA
ncbi:MAG: hypothetical protein KDJ44_09195 [Rhodoblastus sp.]|nr:hypothetical protein [Rhodoblastus sp.]